MPSRRAADAASFTFSTEKGSFSVRSFEGREAISAPYVFSLELAGASPNEDMAAILNTGARLDIRDRSGAVRHVHGLVRSMAQLHTAQGIARYRCELVPRLWYLGKIQDHRIYRNLSAVDIIRRILAEQGFTAGQSAFDLSSVYPPREYCVQYGETCLHFISRLCEEEGIYFYFKHFPDRHMLCFGDREGGPRIAEEAGIRFSPGSGHRPDTVTIHDLSLAGHVRSNAAAYAEWNFRNPGLNLSVKKTGDGVEEAPVPEGMNLEQYRYPHLYRRRRQGERYAALQLGRQLATRVTLEAASDAARFAPGFVFSVHGHPRSEANAGWFILGVDHKGEQPQPLEHPSPEDGARYAATVSAIPERTRFIPALLHPKNRIVGQQTAIVAGPEGEEIFTDAYGRVKLRFFWDRLGSGDAANSRWVRVSQSWAGARYGSMAIPRIGHEVVVSYLEGDPDRPVITGCVHHALNGAPYELPANKTVSGLRSMSTPGKGGRARGFNELRFEDGKGREEIFGHAQKDLHVYVKKDWKGTILRDERRTVESSGYSLVRRDEHHSVGGARKVELRADDHLTVRGDAYQSLDGNLLEQAGREFHLEAARRLVFEGRSEVLIKAGGAGFISITASGLRFSRTAIDLNSGGTAGDGSGARPLLPEKASVPAKPQGPPSPDCLRKASRQRAALCSGGD
ncbi:MAG: type VI secretion system tip protein VgrG [Deltaproteobacteria bacterium]|jgi:type VI secretion system secreted protein VgrG|nr:type VI secretion system tip protein VgrG [Deltaproteobacteria bacterium]